MMLQPIQYRLPDDWDLDKFKSSLADSDRWLEGESGKVSQLYLDSFEWQIWQAGAELVMEQTAAGSQLCWVETNSGERQACLTIESAPGFPSELPDCPLRDRLKQALEVRTLLPVVRIEQQQQCFKVLNEDDKTVLQLIFISSRFSAPDGKLTGTLDGRIMLKPVKGYARPCNAMQSAFESLGMQVVSESLFEVAVTGIGRRPGDYNSKLNYRLDPQGRCDATAKQINLSLLSTLEANVEGAKANLDSEFLHDLRVATRRTRSAMSQIKGVFDEQELEPFKKGFSWLGQATGPTRDMDVYLLKFDNYQQSLPAKIRPDLEPFRDFLQAHHEKAHRDLVRKLKSPHFRKLMKDWRQWLETPVANVSFQPNAVRPIAALADQRIYKMYKRVLKDGKAIHADSPAESLHDLRKDCKKLRYLMEFFQSLYPKPEISVLIKQLKVLLDNLGDFQDLQVQAETIESFGDEMLKEGANAPTLMAMGILVGNLLDRQEQARDEFATLFDSFNTNENARAFKKLFRGQ